MVGRRIWRPLGLLLAAGALAAVVLGLWYGQERARARDSIPLFHNGEGAGADTVDLLSGAVEAEEGSGKLYHLWYHPGDGGYVTLRMDAVPGAERVTTYLVMNGVREEPGSGWYSQDFGIALVVYGTVPEECLEEIEAVEVWARALDGTEEFVRRFPVDIG